MRTTKAARTVCAIVSIACCLSGCAITHEQFASQRRQLSDFQVCEAVVDARKGSSLAYMSDTHEEAVRRGITVSQCTAAVEKDRADTAAAVAAVAAIALVAVVASRGSGTSGAPGAMAYPSTVDTTWEWDEFYNSSFQLVWVCRGVQSGQFADLARCQNKPKVDWKWPGTMDPTK